MGKCRLKIVKMLTKKWNILTKKKIQFTQFRKKKFDQKGFDSISKNQDFVHKNAGIC